jgi:hypothetical protein
LAFSFNRDVAALLPFYRLFIVFLSRAYRRLSLGVHAVFTFIVQDAPRPERSLRDRALLSVHQI